jgi:hypothetical protein
MWTTSRFRAERPSCVAMLFVAGALAIWAGPTPASAQESSQPQYAPDAPRAARPSPSRQVKGEGKVSTRIVRFPVEITAVSVVRVDADLEKMAGKEFLSKAEEPLVIKVRTEKALGNIQRSSSPLIVLNGQNLLNTRATGQQTLVAFLPDRKMLRPTNTIAVVWLGDEQTRTRRPLTLKLEDIPH